MQREREMAECKKKKEGGGALLWNVRALFPKEIPPQE